MEFAHRSNAADAAHEPTVRGGVFPSQWIRGAIKDGFLCASAPFAPRQIQPNSIDLRLGNVGHRVQCSFLPGAEGMATKLKRFRWSIHDFGDEGLVLGQDQPYLFPLMESLALPPDVYARANPKSTTGRLDVFTRLVTENGTAFDEVPAGYRGALYLEVVPRSFAIRVRPGDTLAQIRFQTGDPRLSDQETAALLDSDDILFAPDRTNLRAIHVPPAQGLVFSVGFARDNGPVLGYLAKKNTPPIDLRAIGEARESQHWTPLRPDGDPVILEPDDFYLFRSREMVRLPPDYCAEMVAFDASSGEIRTHYAGFFDSGFGYTAKPGARTGEAAAAVVLEVRSRDVPFLLEDGQPLFRVHLMRSTSPPDLLYGADSGSSYQSQGLRLPKQFAADPAKSTLTPTVPQMELNF